MDSLTWAFAGGMAFMLLIYSVATLILLVVVKEKI